MFHTDTLKEIRMNTNTGVEYEIALFHSLLSIKPDEQAQVMEALSTRNDAAKIRRIIDYTSTRQIESALQSRGMSLVDVTFETQNDGIGPADIVMDVSCAGRAGRIGLSVKYANTCTLNVTGKNFITNAQIDRLRALLPDYTRMYIEEMTNEYGGVGNWFHKRRSSKVTDAYIDLIRDAVIDNWQYVPDKTTLLSTLFHSDSPIEFWVVTYTDKNYMLRTRPQTIDMRRADDITVGKYYTSFVAFYLDGGMVGHMQVKFNNGFLEKCRKAVPDITWQGVRMSYGHPFSSWNFSVEK